MDLVSSSSPAVLADPFAGAVLPAFAPVLQLSAVIAILAFILRKGFELSFGK